MSRSDAAFTGLMIRRRLLISGRVQNVFFRDWAVSQARALGIDGWVRNRADGRVELIAEGAVELVETLIARCREGPSAARVENVAVSKEATGEVLGGFTKRPTA